MLMFGPLIGEASRSSHSHLQKSSASRSQNKAVKVFFILIRVFLGKQRLARPPLHCVELGYPELLVLTNKKSFWLTKMQLSASFTWLGGTKNYLSRLILSHNAERQWLWLTVHRSISVISSIERRSRVMHTSL